MSQGEILFYSAAAMAITFALLAIVINARTPERK